MSTAFQGNAFQGGAFQEGAVASSGSVTITPGTGVLSISGAQPVQGFTLFPSTGVLTITGQQAGRVQGTVITPSTVGVAINGTQPIVGLGIIPATGGLTITGPPPVVGLGILPATGTLTIAGQQAQVSQITNTTITPSTGALTLSGVQPVVGLGIIPGTGTLTLTGTQPVVGASVQITPATGTLTLTGQQPVQGKGLIPATGTLSLTGNAPTLVQGTILTPSTVALTFTGQTPIQGKGIIPATGALTFTGQQAGVFSPVFITPATGALSITGQQPIQGFGLIPATGTLSFTGITPVLGRGIVPATGTLTFTGGQPIQDKGIIPGTGVLSITGQQPNAYSPVVITPTTGSLVITGQQPSVGQFSNVIITPSTGALTLTGTQAVLLRGTVIAPSTGTVTFTGGTPTQGFGLFPVTGTLAISTYAPAVVQGFFRTPSTGTLAINGNQPSITLGNVVMPSTGTLTIAGQQPKQDLKWIIATANLNLVGGQPFLINYKFPPDSEIKITIYKKTHQATALPQDTAARKVRDFENVLWDIRQFETPRHGMRRVANNLLANSDDLVNGGWSLTGNGVGLTPIVTPGQLAPDGTYTAFRIQTRLNGGTLGTDSSYIGSGFAVPYVFDGTHYQLRTMWVKSNNGGNQKFTFIAGGAWQEVATPTWRRICVPYSINNNSYAFGARGSFQTVDVDITVWHPMMEYDVQKSSNHNPSEYVPSWDRQLGYGGVAYFDTYNGNTVTTESYPALGVTSNVVVEKTGADIYPHNETDITMVEPPTTIIENVVDDTIIVNTTPTTVATVDKGYALKFNSLVEDTAVRVNSASLAVTTSNPFTWEMWARVEVTPGEMPLISNRTNFGGSTYLGFASLHLFWYGITGGGWNTGTDTPAGCVIPNRVQHYVWSYDGTTMRMYVDGVLRGTKVGVSLAGNGVWDFGWDQANSGFEGFVGTIGEVRRWNRCLSGSEIASRYAGQEVDLTSLAGWWRFTEGTGVTTIDASGNGITGTLIGSGVVASASTKVGYLPKWVAGILPHQRVDTTVLTR